MILHYDVLILSKINPLIHKMNLLAELLLLQCFDDRYDHFFLYF